LAGYTSVDPCRGVRLAGTGVTLCNAGIVGAASGGQALDTLLYGVYIQVNAAAVTVTIAGLVDSTGAAASLLITGSTTSDYFWMPPAPILNSFAALTFQASVAALAWVFARAYIGPESPR
jgi:hypothetical protein